MPKNPPSAPANTTIRERLAKWAEGVLGGAAAGIPVAAAASSVPEVMLATIAGNMAVQAAMTLVGGPGVGERIISWGQETAEALEELSAKVDGLTPEKLQSNPAFITAVAHASQAVGRTHQEEKRRWLRNAVLNVAAERAPDDDLQLMFFNAVDEFTPWHVKVLDLFRDPTAKGVSPDTWSAGSRVHVVDAHFPELRQRRDLVSAIVHDLHARGFLAVDNLATMVSGRGMVEKITTPMGDEFLDFVVSDACPPRDNQASTSTDDE